MILLVLAALVVRVDASPLDDAQAEAIRYANILTGDEPEDDPALASRDLDDANEDDDVDEDADDTDDVDDDELGGADDDDRRGALGARLGDADDDGRGAPRSDERLGDADDDGIDGSRTNLRLGDADGDGRGVPRSDPRLGDTDDDDRREPGSARRPGDVGEVDLAGLEDASSELSGAAGHLPGELAMLEAGTTDAGVIVGEDVSFAAASAGAAETYESWMRHQRPSRWGRLDLGLSWRRRWSEPMSGMSRRYDELWLIATWRR